MNTKRYILAVILGLVMPVIGLFVGLQVSTTLGNVLAFPLIAVSMVSGVPLGMWSPALWLTAFLLSVAIWLVVLYIVQKLRTPKA